MTRTSSTCLLAILVIIVAKSTAQNVTTHQAPCLKDPTGNLFFRLNRDGTKLLVNSSVTREVEKLVLLPREGSAEQIWHSSAGRTIFNRIALSGDGQKVAFACYPGSKVYALNKPGGTPTLVADVQPNGDIRQLILSGDGRWAAFTASTFRENGILVPLRASLYVAATDGSAVHRITATPIRQKYIPSR